VYPGVPPNTLPEREPLQTLKHETEDELTDATKAFGCDKLVVNDWVQLASRMNNVYVPAHKLVKGGFVVIDVDPGPGVTSVKL
jgi:hypothetical protein